MNLCINATGFVSQVAGSVASANAVLLSKLVERDIRISFFTKPSFVDPRPLFQGTSNANQFGVIDCTNIWGDRLRRFLAPNGSGIWGRFWGGIDAATYNRGLVRRMRASKGRDLDLWLGDWAHGQGKRPVVSFVQGPPGTDARSVSRHRELIERLAGKVTWLKLFAYAKWRLGPGLPNFHHSDHIIVGSEWSRRHLVDQYHLPAERIHALPYPIDLEMFQPSMERRPSNERLRLFWLGRFVPRKRLDLFLDGLALAIRAGCDVESWVVGRSGFVPGYEQLLDEFPFPDRLKRWAVVPRDDVPEMLSQIDVMAQPSDEENFGSSVAEALACGVPVIVGATNGTGDYICDRSIRLADDKTETMASAIVAMAEAKKRGDLADRGPSRAIAEKYFDPAAVTDRLEEILKLAVGG